VIRVEAGMSTTRFCELIDMPERTWRRWHAKTRAGGQGKGQWPRPAREAALELASKQVRRIGLNVNQAARVLNATGEPPVWLEQALAMTERAVTRLDDAATAVADVARQHRPRTSRPFS
jgi:hypothetical protein